MRLTGQHCRIEWTRGPGAAAQLADDPQGAPWVVAAAGLHVAFAPDTNDDGPFYGALCITPVARVRWAVRRIGTVWEASFVIEVGADQIARCTLAAETFLAVVDRSGGALVAALGPRLHTIAGAHTILAQFEAAGA